MSSFSNLDQDIQEAAQQGCAGISPIGWEKYIQEQYLSRFREELIFGWEKPPTTRQHQLMQAERDAANALQEKIKFETTIQTGGSIPDFYTPYILLPTFDFHREAAAEWLGIPASEVTEIQRSEAKIRNFRRLYGVTYPAKTENNSRAETKIGNSGGPAPGCRNVMTLTEGGIEYSTQNKQSEFLAECYEKLIKSSTSFAEMYENLSSKKQQEKPPKTTFKGWEVTFGRNTIMNQKWLHNVSA